MYNFMVAIRRIFNILPSWLPLAVAISGLCGLVYLAVQQNIRSGADDPQIQIAGGVTENLNSGQDPTKIIPNFNIDISKSLDVFVAVFDNDGKVKASSAQLNNLVVPEGVFNYVRNHGENRFTWQPTAGVRSAVVVTKYKDGFVLVGRSLREVERREDRLLQQVGLAWAAIMAATFFATAFLEFAVSKKR